MNKDIQTEKRHNKVLIIVFAVDLLLFVFAILIRAYDVLKSPFYGLPGIQSKGSSGSFWKILMIICAFVFIILILLLVYWKSYAILGVKTTTESKAEMARNGIVLTNKSDSKDTKNPVIDTKAKNEGQNMELF